MNSKNIFFGVVVIVVAAGAFVLWKSQSPQNASTHIATETYFCDGGKTITAAYYQGPEAPQPAPGEPPTPTGSVEVSIQGAATTTLKQTISADGARYANADESLVFWNKGEEALILRNNSMDLDYTNCTSDKNL